MTVPIEVGIHQLCITAPAITAIIADRMAPHMQAETSPRPFIVYSRIVADHQHHLGGASGLVFVRLQLDLFADDASELYALAEAVRMRLDGYRGTVTYGTEDLVLQFVELVEEQSSSETPNDGSDSAPHRFRMDFRISALVPVPSLN